MKKLISTPAIAACTIAVLTTGAYAEHLAAQEIEEVIVTAEKREQTLQDVPLAISAFTEKTLDEIGGTDFEQFARAIPGVEIQSSRAGENRITMRGVSVQTGTAPSVGVYIDEIPVATFAGEQINLRTYDVERLEVLRGPQGTLYGEGNLGGTVRIVTNKPDLAGFDAGFKVIGSDTKYGGYNGDYSAMLNVPLVEDKAGLRFVGIVYENDGWIDNVVTGEDKVNTDKGYTYRVAGRFQPTEKFTIDLSYITQEIKSGGPPVADEDYNTHAAIAETAEDNLDLTSLTMSYEFDWGTLVSATGYMDRSAMAVNDFSAVAPLLSILFGTPIDIAYIDRPNDQEIFTQEVRLVSAGDGPLTWTFGGFYKDNTIVISNSSNTEPAIPVPIFNLLVDEKIKQWAAFGEMTYAFTDRFHGLVGLRYFKEDRTVDSDVSGLLPLILSGVPESMLRETSSESKVTPKFTAYFDVDENAMVYATISNGFRAGGINPQAFLFPGAPTSYGPESLWNYELGAKTRLLDGKMILNGAIYYMDWDDVIIDAVTGDPLFAFSVNGGRAHTSGIEAEMQWMPTERWEFRLSGNITDAVLDETFDVGDTQLTAVEGAKLPLVPRYKVYAAAQYTFPAFSSFEGRGRVDVTRNGSSYSNILNTPELKNDPYTVVNARFGIINDSWELYAFAYNIANERGELQTSFDGQSTIIPPRTIGLSLQYNY